MDSLLEVGLLSATREQVAGRVADDARGDPQLSPLLTRYAAVRQTAGIAQLMAIDLVCSVDEYQCREGRCTAIIGPPTIPGAGLGVVVGKKSCWEEVVLGRSTRNQNVPYLGPVRTDAEANWRNAYRLEIGGGCPCPSLTRGGRRAAAAAFRPPNASAGRRGYREPDVPRRRVGRTRRRTGVAGHQVVPGVGAAAFAKSNGRSRSLECRRRQSLSWLPSPRTTAIDVPPRGHGSRPVADGHLCGAA